RRSRGGPRADALGRPLARAGAPEERRAQGARGCLQDASFRLAPGADLGRGRTARVRDDHLVRNFRAQGHDPQDRDARQFENAGGDRRFEGEATPARIRHRAHRRLGRGVCRAGALGQSRLGAGRQGIGREARLSLLRNRQEKAMKICHYNEGLAGAVVGEKLYPIGDALMKAGHLKPGYTMLEVIERLANEPAAMKLARFATQTGSFLPLVQARLLAPLLDPPATWAEASYYKAQQSEMREKLVSSYRSTLSKDALMAEFFFKPSSSIIGPGGSVILPRISRDVDFECELCAVIGKTAQFA